MLSALYNTVMADTDMLDTDYLFQPRGQGTGWCFRMITPHVLIGRTNTFNQGKCLRAVGFVAAGQDEPNRVAQGIGQGVYLGRQPSLGTANGFRLRIPPFAPARCW